MSATNPYAPAANHDSEAANVKLGLLSARGLGLVAVVTGVAASIVMVETQPFSFVFDSLGSFAVAIIFLPALYWEACCRVSGRSASFVTAILSSLGRCWWIYWFACLLAFIVLRISVDAVVQPRAGIDHAVDRELGRILLAASTVFGMSALASYDVIVARRQARQKPRGL